MRLVCWIIAAIIIILNAGDLSARERKPAQITVQPRSYLEAGTDVIPDSQSYNHYATQPGTTPLSATDYGISNHSSLPGRFEAGKSFKVDFRAPPELMR